MIRPTSGSVLMTLLLASVRAGSGQDRPPIPPPPPPAAPEGRIGPVADVARMFAPAPDAPLDQVQIAGQSASGPVPVLGWDRVYRLALIRAQPDAPPRADALDPARLDEQARRLGLDDFTRARDRLAARGFRDPAADFLGLQVQLYRIATARASLIASQRWLAVFQELIEGQSFGLNDLDLGRFYVAVGVTRRELAQAIDAYRDRLDRFKVALGLAPGAVVTIDLGPLAAFAATFANVDRWRAAPRRRAEDLERILEQLPALGDLAPDLGPALAEAEQAPERLEAALAAATRLALAHRRDGDEPADEVELRVRRRLRHLLELRREYAYAARSLSLSTLAADASVEQIIAPPTGGAPRLPAPAIVGLLDEARQAATQRDHLVALWGEFRAERLAFDYDLGLARAADWPSFLGRFHAGPLPGPFAPREPDPPVVPDRPDLPAPPAALPPPPPPPPGNP